MLRRQVGKTVESGINCRVGIGRRKQILFCFFFFNLHKSVDDKLQYNLTSYRMIFMMFFVQRKGVRTVAVGIGSSIDNDELLEIAAGNPNYVTRVSDFNDLKNNLQRILLESCQGKRIRGNILQLQL